MSKTDISDTFVCVMVVLISPTPLFDLKLQLKPLHKAGLQCFDAVGWAAGRASGL